MGYLKNEIIKNVKYKYEGGKLDVSSDSTLFCGVKKLEYHSLEDILKLYKEVKALAKVSGVKLTGHKVINWVKDNMDEYTRLVACQNKEVDELARLWYKKVTEYPIRMGCVADKGCKYLYKRYYNIEKLYWADSITSKIHSVYSRLADVKENLLEDIKGTGLYGKLVKCNLDVIRV